jgi:hypothetical protein
MDYVISETYYKAILVSLRRDNKSANHQSVIEYLNKTAGLRFTIVNVRISA